MRKLAGMVAAAALMGAASVAYAATTAGDVTDINAARHSITLNNGSTFMAPRKADLANLKVGEKVRVAYVMRHGANDAMRIAPAVGSDADLGG